MVSSIGNIRVEPRGAVDVDVIDPQALQGIGEEALHGLRAGVIAEPGPARFAHGAELDADEGLIAVAALERLADQHLVMAHAVEIARIEQGDAGLQRRMDGGDALGPVGRSVHARHAHAAEAEGGNGGAGLSKRRCCIVVIS